MRFLDDVFDMSGGYVLDFSNRTFIEFFEDEFGINIYDEKYGVRGESKANHLRAQIVARSPERDLASTAETRFFDLVAGVESASSSSVLSSLSGVAKTLDFDTVSRDLERALSSAQADPEDAVTAACSTVESVCRSILIELGMGLPDRKDVKSLFAAVRKQLGLSTEREDFDPTIADDVRKILNGLATVVEGIGALRTHGGDAHGRERGYARIDPRIARLAIHGASTVALFLIETWQRKHPRRELKLR
jgi:hypothetical protein